MTDPVSPKDPVVPHFEKAPAAPTAFETGLRQSSA